MVTISDAAAAKVKEILNVEGKPAWGLRIHMVEGGCCGPSFGMNLEEKSAEGDEIIEKNGLNIFIDRKTFQQMDGMNVDYIKNNEQEGFAVTGGKQSACGSGCSTEGSSCGSGGGCGCS
ncbi:MAG: iron-sulfur cluster assembly accessory protein [Nitrospiraceae bacterium]|nr:iron-sulfur cluster assembly accessory protein [Nitrospiraceae bacterium]